MGCLVGVRDRVGTIGLVMVGVSCTSDQGQGLASLQSG